MEMTLGVLEVCRKAGVVARQRHEALAACPWSADYGGEEMKAAWIAGWKSEFYAGMNCLFVAIVHVSQNFGMARSQEVDIFTSETVARKFIEISSDQAGTWFGSEYRCSLSSGLPNGRLMGEVFARNAKEEIL